MPKKKKVYEAYREDASHLGGPMGTEYTIPIEHKLFTDLEKAFAYLETVAEKYGEAIDRKRWNGKEYSQDIRCEIVGIRLKEVK
jgi:hypothetical protein